MCTINNNTWIYSGHKKKDHHLYNDRIDRLMVVILRHIQRYCSYIVTGHGRPDFEFRSDDGHPRHWPLGFFSVQRLP